MDRGRLIGIALVVVSAAGFGSGTVLSKPIYGAGLDWLELLVWRFFLGSLLAWGWVLISESRRAMLKQLAPREALVAIGLGIWYTGNAGTYYAGLETVPAGLAGVLVYIYPAIVAVLSLRFAQRLSGWRPWAALAMALIGVVLALGGIGASAALPVTGILLILASPLIYAGWIVLSARLAGERSDRLAPEQASKGPRQAGAAVADSAVTTALMMSATTVIFGILAILTGRRVAPAEIPVAGWLPLLAIGFASTFVAIQTFYAGARRIGAAQAALVSTVEPIIIVGLATVLLGERLEPIQLVGAGLIIVGVVIAQTAPRPQGAPEPARPLDAEG